MSKQTYERILVVTDGLSSSDPTHETAFNLAKRDIAKVKLVDTLKPPGTTSKWFSSNATDVFEMVLADKQERLERIAENFRNAGIAAETQVLFGKSSEAITREAINWNASLVVRYMKGMRSQFPGLFGNTARSLIRFCPSPILLVGDRPIDEPRVLACVDTEHDDKENSSIINHSSCLAGENDRLSGLYCWELYGRDQIKSRMTESSFKESLEFAESVFRKSFDKFVESHDLSMFGNGVRIENGDPPTVIPEFCRHEEIDVVTMCSATLNHPLRRLFGSTVEAVIDKLPCSLLVVKPVGFVSPVATANETVVASSTS